MMRKEENLMRVKNYGKEALWERNKAVSEEDSQQSYKDTITKVTAKISKKYLNLTNSVFTKVWFTQGNLRLKT